MAESQARIDLALARGCFTGVYGGYFGAAQGVLLIAVLGIGLAESLPYDQRDEERAGNDRQHGRGSVLRDRQSR